MVCVCSGITFVLLFVHFFASIGKKVSLVLYNWCFLTSKFMICSEMKISAPTTEFLPHLGQTLICPKHLVESSAMFCIPGKTPPWIWQRNMGTLQQGWPAAGREGTEESHQADPGHTSSRLRGTTASTPPPITGVPQETWRHAAHVQDYAWPSWYPERRSLPGASLRWHTRTSIQGVYTRRYIKTSEEPSCYPSTGWLEPTPRQRRWSAFNEQFQELSRRVLGGASLCCSALISYGNFS